MSPPIRRAFVSRQFLLCAIISSSVAVHAANAGVGEPPPPIKPVSNPPKTEAEAIRRLHAFNVKLERVRVLQNDGLTTIATFSHGGDEVLAAVAQNAALFPKVSLQFYHLRHMTPAGVAQIATLKNVVELNIGESNVTDEAVAKLAGLNQLRRLRLSHNRHPDKVTNKSLQVIARLPKLEELEILHAAVDDEGLKFLKHANRLSRLWLHYTRVSDDGLKHLKDVPSLKTLFISPTLISKDGRKELLRDRPKLEFARHAGTQFWNWRSGKIRTSYSIGGMWLRFSRDGKTLLSAAHTDFDLFDFPSGRFTRRLTPELPLAKNDTVTFRDVAVSPSGERLAVGVGRAGRSVAVFDARNGKTLQSLETDVPPKTPVSATMQSLSYSPDGKRIAACVEGRVNVWDLKTGKRIFARGPYEHPAMYYNFARISPDGKRLLLHSGSRVQLWDLPEQKMLGEHGGVNIAGFRKDGSVLAVNLGILSKYDRVQAKRDAPPELIRLVKLGKWKSESGAALHAEAELAAIVVNRTALVLNLKTGKVENELPLPPGHVLKHMQFSASGGELFLDSRAPIDVQMR
jgi:WD40 repeat protein